MNVPSFTELIQKLNQNGCICSTGSVSVRELTSSYKRLLPLLILVRTGYCSTEDVFEFSSGEIFRVSHCLQQKRVVLRDSSGQLLSFPEDHPLMFLPVGSQVNAEVTPSLTLLKVINSREFKNGGYRSIKAAPDKNGHRNIKFFASEDMQVSTETLGDLEIVDVYDESYLVANYITSYGVDQTPFIIPVWLTMHLDIVTGIKDCAQIEFDQFLKHLDIKLKNVAGCHIPGNKEIMVFDGDLSDYSQGYDYVRPTTYIRLDQVNRKETKPQEASNYEFIEINASKSNSKKFVDAGPLPQKTRGTPSFKSRAPLPDLPQEDKQPTKRCDNVDIQSSESILKAEKVPKQYPQPLQNYEVVDLVSSENVPSVRNDVPPPIQNYEIVDLESSENVQSVRKGVPLPVQNYEIVDLPTTDRVQNVAKQVPQPTQHYEVDLEPSENVQKEVPKRGPRSSPNYEVVNLETTVNAVKGQNNVNPKPQIASRSLNSVKHMIKNFGNRFQRQVSNPNHQDEAATSSDNVKKWQLSDSSTHGYHKLISDSPLCNKKQVKHGSKNATDNHSVVPPAGQIPDNVGRKESEINFACSFANIQENDYVSVAERGSNEADEPAYQSHDEVKKPIVSMSVAEVAAVLKLLKLNHYVNTFKENDIDGSLLVAMNKEMLIGEFGFSSFEAIKLTKFANGWKCKHSS